MTAVSPGLGWRDRALATLGETAFDLLVVGGGIVGCGVARDAAMRGLRVALVEQDDFASGTSSRSSRLVHGGVRYLEHGHLHLVFESSRERRRLLRLAPHLVRPLAFTWPVYEGARVAQWKLLAGLTLYDALALFRNVGNHRRLTPDAVLAREPMLAAGGLVGGATYWDASTNDTRLTLANALGARRAGATVLNHARVTSLAVAGGRAVGAHVRDVESGRELAVRARVVVSAVGPWTNALQPMEGMGEAPAVLGSAGVHIAVPRERVGNRDAITLVAPQDGRVMFVLPAGPHAIIGTTETPATRGPDDVRATREEVRYLLQACNASFPAAALRDDVVVAAWSGIRPLAATLADGDAGSASREHTVALGALGVLWVTGGKLTTYRAMAEDVVDRACLALGEHERSGRPYREVLLPGGAMASLASTEGEVRAAVGHADVARHLAGAYGSDWREAWRPVRDDPTLAERLDAALPYTGADVVHAVEREMAVTLADILVRRTHVAFETRDQGGAAARAAAALLARRLGWDRAQERAALSRYEQDAARLFTVEPA
jgi:glycerol-3-phosphate dehydrogenase